MRPRAWGGSTVPSRRMRDGAIERMKAALHAAQRARAGCPSARVNGFRAPCGKPRGRPTPRLPRRKRSHSTSGEAAQHNSAAKLPGGSETAVRHVRRSCDFSSLTSSAAHSRASGIFPASRKARAFAKAWLSADRSAADSFPGRAPLALRSAADVLRICDWSNGFGGRQISTVNGSIATSIRARQPGQIGHRADTLSWNRNSVSPVERPGRGKRARSPVGDQPEPRRGTRMATNSVPNAGRAGYRKAQDPRGSRRTNTARLPLRTAWTVTLVLSLGLWGMIWLVVSSLASASPCQHP
jgi:hypothetical protein